MGRKDTRRLSSGTTSAFPKMGADGPEVVNASAWTSHNPVLPRDRSTVAAQPPAQSTAGHRRPVPQPGQPLGDQTEAAPTIAARNVRLGQAVEEGDAGARTVAMWRHLFGIAPGRTRA